MFFISMARLQQKTSDKNNNDPKYQNEIEQLSKNLMEKENQLTAKLTEIKMLQIEHQKSLDEIVRLRNQIWEKDKLIHDSSNNNFENVEKKLTEVIKQKEKLKEENEQLNKKIKWTWK